MNFAEKLKQLRKQKNMTQDELARQIIVSRSVIAKYETGRAYPSSENLKRIADVFDVSIDVLLSDEEKIEVVLKTKQSLKNIQLIFHILMIIFSILFILFLLLPIFSYGHYVYPIPEGQNAPTYIHGTISLMTACSKVKNYIGFVAIFLSIINISMSSILIFAPSNKVVKYLKIINAIIFFLGIIFTFLTFSFGVSTLSNLDFGMNTVS